MGNYYGSIAFLILFVSKINCCMRTGQQQQHGPLQISQNFVPRPPPHTLGESNLRERLLDQTDVNGNREMNIMEKYKSGAIPDEYLSGQELSSEVGSKNLVGRNSDGAGLFLSRLEVEIAPPDKKNGTVRFITVKNRGELDDVVKMSVYNSEGRVVPVFPSEFPLASGSSTEIPLNLEPSLLSARNSGVNLEETTAHNNPLEGLVTIHARGKRDSIKRSFFFEGEQPYAPGIAPLEQFCVDKSVSGTCRYRSDPEDCFKWQWTAYATIYNRGGSQTISSVPSGIAFDQGEHGRVRVYLTVSCCTPVVEFIGTDSYYQNHRYPVQGNTCFVDVRDLQNLHPGEIVGIVLGVLLLVIIIIVIIILCVRKRRKETLNSRIVIHPTRCTSRNRGEASSSGGARS